MILDVYAVDLEALYVDDVLDDSMAQHAYNSGRHRMPGPGLARPCPCPIAIGHLI